LDLVLGTSIIVEAGMAGIVADYNVVSRGKTELKVGGDIDKDFPFDLPGQTKDSRTVVSFFLISSDNLQMTVDIDGTEVSDRSYTNGAERCIQDVAPPELHISPGPHKMNFKVSQGEVAFSDVVLWFQREA
jgi:hypothetical protein